MMSIPSIVRQTHPPVWFMVLLLHLFVGCTSTQAVDTKPAPAPSSQPAQPQPPPPPEPEPAAVPTPEEPSQTQIRQTFVARMESIRTGMDRLGSDTFDTSRYLDALLVAGEGGREQAFPKVLDTLKMRLQLEAKILTDIDAARILYQQFGATTATESNRLQAMNMNMDHELGLLNQEIVVQNKRLAKTFNTDRELKIFTHFADQKEQFVSNLQTRLKEYENLPELDNYFDRWTELIKMRILSDQYQILNLAYYAKAYDYTDGVNEVMNAVATITAADYLKDLGQENVNAAALTTVLDAGFSEMVKTVYKPEEEEQSSRKGFQVSLRPDRGLGGVYYYSDSPEGLENPTKVTRPDGSFYFAERVSFILNSTRDCNFRMRHIDARGKVVQICPNEYAPDVNHLQANVPRVIPGDDMPFEFATTEPPGIEAIRLVVTPKQLAYDPRIDKLEIPSDEAVDEEISLTRGNNTRGLQVQRRQTAAEASSIDQAYYDDAQAGNAVQVETFIRVVPLRR